jgi:hypothetical protein
MPFFFAFGGGLVGLGFAIAFVSPRGGKSRRV